jgi:tRNA pseudouridine-54 N-methylase
MLSLLCSLSCFWLVVQEIGSLKYVAFFENLIVFIVRLLSNSNPLFIFTDPEMQSNIDKTLHTGHASYKVSLAIGFVHIWEAATLSIEREGYTIKCNNDLTITEKFSASTAVKIPFEKPAELVIIGSDGSEHCLRVDNEWPDISSRDEIVLTLRSFIKTALQRGKKGFKIGEVCCCI